MNTAKQLPFFSDAYYIRSYLSNKIIMSTLYAYKHAVQTLMIIDITKMQQHH